MRAVDPYVLIRWHLSVPFPFPFPQVTNVLNMTYVWYRPPRPAVEVARELRQTALRIYGYEGWRV